MPRIQSDSRRQGQENRVEGRVEGAEEFWVTRTEALYGKNSATGFRLALVSVRPADPEEDTVRYIIDPFRDVDFGDCGLSQRDDPAAIGDEIRGAPGAGVADRGGEDGRRRVASDAVRGKGASIHRYGSFHEIACQP